MNRTLRRQAARELRRSVLNPKQRTQLHHQHARQQSIQATLRLLNGHTEFTEAEQIKLTLPVRIALERLKIGHANEADFHDIACAVNILIVCGEQISSDVLQAANLAAEALMRCLARQQTYGRWGLDGQGIAAIQEALSIYEQLTALVTAAQFQAAILEARRRMQAGDFMEVKTEKKP